MGEDALYRVNRVSQLGNLLTVEAGIDQLLQRIPDEPTTHRAHHHRYNNPSDRIKPSVASQDTGHANNNDKRRERIRTVMPGIGFNELRAYLSPHTDCVVIHQLFNEHRGIGYR